MQWEFSDDPAVQPAGNPCGDDTSKPPDQSTHSQQTAGRPQDDTALASAAAIPPPGQSWQVAITKQQTMNDLWIHALLPQQLHKGTAPHISIVQSVLVADSSSSKQHGKPAREQLLLLDKAPMQQLGSSSCSLVHWCCGPVSKDQWLAAYTSSGSSSTGGSRKHSAKAVVQHHATVDYEVSRGGILPGSRKHKLQQLLLSGVTHH